MSNSFSEVNQVLQDEYNKYEAARKQHEKLNIISTIIQTKLKVSNPNSEIFLYADVKKFLYHSVHACEESHYQYYEFDTQKIKKFIDYLKLEERIEVLEYLIKELKKNGNFRNVLFFSKCLKKEKIAHFFFNPSFIGFFKMVFTTITYNFFTLISTIIVLYLSYSLILLTQNGLFKIEYVIYSKNAYVNHFLNTALSFCQVDTDFKTTPLNWKGVLMQVLFQLVLLTLTLNIILKETKKHFSFEE